MTRLVNTGKNGRNGDCVIHTDADCMFVTEDSLPVEDAPVDADELDTCAWCAQDVPRTQNQGRECPFCHDTVSKLPNHIPDCSEAP